MSSKSRRFALAIDVGGEDRLDVEAEDGKVLVVEVRDEGVVGAPGRDVVERGVRVLVQATKEGDVVLTAIVEEVAEEADARLLAVEEEAAEIGVEGLDADPQTVEVEAVRAVPEMLVDEGLLERQMNQSKRSLFSRRVDASRAPSWLIQRQVHVERRPSCRNSQSGGRNVVSPWISASECMKRMRGRHRAESRRRRGRPRGPRESPLHRRSAIGMRRASSRSSPRTMLPRFTNQSSVPGNRAVRLQRVLVVRVVPALH